jgi:hypothetical protein
MYEELTVTWIQGKKPVLTIKEDDGTLLETIELAPFNYNDLHGLMMKKGFTVRDQAQTEEAEATILRNIQIENEERANFKKEKYDRMMAEEATKAAKQEAEEAEKLEAFLAEQLAAEEAAKQEAEKAEQLEDEL